MKQSYHFLVFFLLLSSIGEIRAEKLPLLKATSERWNVMSLTDESRIVCQSLSREQASPLVGGYRSEWFRSRPFETWKSSDEKVQGAIQSEWVVNFSGFSPEAKTAFLHAVLVWADLISSNVPIVIDAFVDDSASGAAVVSISFTGPWILSGEDVFLPAALTDHIIGYDAEPGQPDIVVAVRRDQSEFYFGLDGATPANKLDFVSIIVHELAHGLGISSSYVVGGDGKGYYGYETDPPSPDQPLPLVFDTFVCDAREIALTGDAPALSDKQSFQSGSVELAAALTSDQLYFLGPISAILSGRVVPIPLYAPRSFSWVSSVSHLDEIAFPPGGIDSLMTPGISLGESNHHPGPIAVGILAELGWTVYFEKHLPQFGVGAGVASDIVITNPYTNRTLSGDIYVFDPVGQLLDTAVLFPNLTTTAFNLEPLASVTLRGPSTGPLNTGSVKVATTLPVSGMIRFDLQGTGVAGVGHGEVADWVILPVRRSEALSTGVAIRNVGASAIDVDLSLANAGERVPNGVATRQIPANGRIAEFIQELFPAASTADFTGTLEVRARAGRFAAIGLELEVGKRFTTLPVTLVR
ncbi:MAG: hypothetical protein JSU96_02080 [Acidobacteriota bacterium]|nr:MAG: hypothetical protein JSU96_02080 [Acidobacteriota bacterium]